MKPVRETAHRFRFIPVVATACAIIVVVMVGYFFQERRLDSGNEMASSAEFMPNQDLEVIRHFDLLRDMDTIEKLIHVVDLPENGNGTGSEQGVPETQGMHRDEIGKNYA
jgi:hypothetical protein